MIRRVHVAALTLVAVATGLASCSANSESSPFAAASAAATGGAGGATATVGAGGAGGSGGSTLSLSSGTSMVVDADDDGLDDDVEGTEDSDGDGLPNYKDPVNDGPPTAVSFVPISTPFNTPIGIDFHEPTNTVVVSVNYGTSGQPYNFERIQFDGTHQPFSNLNGLTEEVKIATARSANPQGFVVGDLFVGSGVDGHIVRITDNGQTVLNPWVDLPGPNNGLMRGSLYVDRTGVWNGDLLVGTTLGEVWRITAAGVPTKVAAFGVHLEGLVTVPDKPARYGPLAGRALLGAEEQGILYALKPDGTFDVYQLGVLVEDLDFVSPGENFFGVNFGTSKLLGAEAAQWKGMVGDILAAQETPTGSTSLFRIKWDGAKVVAEQVPLAPTSATVGQWEHVTFAGAGIVEIPPPK